MQALKDLEERMAAVCAFSFIARSGPLSKMDWNGRAAGKVNVVREDNSLVFNESGRFTPSGGAQAFSQTNVYRWDFLGESVNVYQERRGEPVFLVNLIYASGIWKTREAHLCVKDLYTLTLTPRTEDVLAVWEIEGPTKDERLEYVYR